MEQIRQKEKYTASPFVLGCPRPRPRSKPTGELIRLHRAGEVSFSNVVTFNMDEYVGLPEEHPRATTPSCARTFAHVDIRPENTHLLDGNAEDLAKECADYEARIAECGGIDLFLGGVGEDGHIAFNEPFSSLVAHAHQDADAGYRGGQRPLLRRRRVARAAHGP